jgi:hypothetical protein
MIFSRHKLILLHVPKTGGNSLQRGLVAASDDSLKASSHRDGLERFEIEGLSPHKHATLAEYDSVVDISSYRIAVTVREPLARAVSMFFSPHRWFKKSDNEWSLRRPVWDREAFFDCLAEMKTVTDFLLVDGELREPDHVVRYERLQDDYAQLADATGLPLVSLPHLNRSAATPEECKAVQGDRLVRRAVQERFASDYLQFGYAMD